MTALDDLRKEIADLRKEIADLHTEMRNFVRPHTTPLDYGDFLGVRPTQSATDNSVDFETLYKGEPE